MLSNIYWTIGNDFLIEKSGPAPSACRSTSSPPSCLWFPPLPLPGLHCSFRQEVSLVQLFRPGLSIGMARTLPCSVSWQELCHSLVENSVDMEHTQHGWYLEHLDIGVATWCCNTTPNLKHAATSSSPGVIWKTIVLTHYLQLYSQRSSLKGQPAVPGPFRNTQFQLQLFHYLAVGCVLSGIKRRVLDGCPVLAVCIFINFYAKI